MLEGIAVHLYLLLVLLLSSEAWRRSCPQSCRCSVELQEVNCSDGLLTTVPDALPPNTTLLNLTRNQIKTLVHQQFPNLMQLLVLDLSNNVVVTIEVEAFYGLQSLRSLCLARNHLKVIPAGVFAGLAKLEFLDISSNEILVFLDFTFRDLTAMKFINAADNSLVFISRQAFAGLTSLQELRLDGCNLTAVPTEPLTQLGGLRSLYFHRLGLATLPDYCFRHLEHLKELVITSCGLQTLSGNSLFGLNLTSLTIRRCNLAAVPYTPLHHLVYLVYLDLSYNPITVILGNLLADLLRLQKLHLVGGSLLHIETGAFRGLAQLKLLNVSRNLLTTLEAGAFHAVDTLRTLGLDNNPLTCDCRLLWVVRRQPHLDFGANPPTCSTSVSWQAWSFLDVTEGELTCRQPRILSSKPQEVRVDQGRTVVASCRAEGDPLPSVTWISPQLKPLSATGRIRSLANGSLEVRYAQPQDSGAYLCVASNAAGNDSLLFRLHVRAFPSTSRNPFLLKGWFPSASPGGGGNQNIPSDVKTLLAAATIGFLSFFSSVSVCFIFMFLWSKTKGQIKHTATIAYVPRRAGSSTNKGKGSCTETSRFTMKLM